MPTSTPPEPERKISTPGREELPAEPLRDRPESTREKARPEDDTRIERFRER